MIQCSCCHPPKQYSAPKALYKHQRKYDPNFVAPSRTPVKEAYEANPLKCERCSENISYNTYRNSGGKPRYCSNSCSTTVNNLARGSKKPKPKAVSTSRQISKREIVTCACCPNTFTKRNESNIFCSLKCHRKQKWDTKVSDPKTIWSSRLRKKQLLEELGNRCQFCGNEEWMGRPIALEIEHIDGNHLNNSRENTTLLCPNCHANTPTYKGRNRGNGRAFRRQRYAEGKSY